MTNNWVRFVCRECEQDVMLIHLAEMKQVQPCRLLCDSCRVGKSNGETTLRESIENAIIETISASSHHCMANSEGDICCCDPRPTQAVYMGGQKAGEPRPGDAVQEGLIDRLVEAVEQALVSVSAEKS